MKTAIWYKCVWTYISYILLWFVAIEKSVLSIGVLFAYALIMATYVCTAQRSKKKLNVKKNNSVSNYTLFELVNGACDDGGYLRIPRRNFRDRPQPERTCNYTYNVITLSAAVTVTHDRPCSYIYCCIIILYRVRTLYIILIFCARN